MPSFVCYCSVDKIYASWPLPVYLGEKIELVCRLVRNMGVLINHVIYVLHVILHVNFEVVQLLDCTDIVRRLKRKIAFELVLHVLPNEYKVFLP